MTTRFINIIGLLITGLLIIITYKSTLLWMYQRYMGADSYYSHGFIVPFVSLFFAWQLKHKILSAEKKPSLAGLYLIIFALLLHIAGTVLYIFSISGFSLWFLVIGLVMFLYGRDVARIVWFPLLFLVFMLPLPMAVIGKIAFPLKIFAAKAGVWIVSIFGVPVHGEGFNIFIPAGHLLVGNPCSGLRSLIAFMALGAVFAYTTPVSTLKKIFLFILSIPVALISNIIRVPILIMASQYGGLEAAAPDTLVHTGSGLLVFVIGFLLIFAAARVLER